MNAFLIPGHDLAPPCDITNLVDLQVDFKVLLGSEFIRADYEALALVFG